MKIPPPNTVHHATVRTDTQARQEPVCTDAPTADEVTSKKQDDRALAHDDAAAVLNRRRREVKTGAAVNQADGQESRHVSRGQSRVFTPGAAVLPSASDIPDTGAQQESQLRESQKDMTRLGEAIARRFDFAKQQLDDEMSKLFPSLRGSDFAQTLEVRTTQEEMLPLAERTPEGGHFRRTEVKSEPLLSLYLRATQGETPPGFVVSDTDIVSGNESVKQVPPTLNSADAKYKIEKLLTDTTSSSFERRYTVQSNNFWDKPANFSQGHSVKDWLGLEFGAQLRAEAGLRAGDNTLSTDALSLVDKVLASPDVQSRHLLPASDRPGVYALSVAAQDDNGVSTPLRGAFVLTQRDDDDDLGRVILWRAGKPLEEFDDIAAMTDSLKANGQVQGEAYTVPVDENILSRRVNDLRASISDTKVTANISQYLDLTTALSGREKLRDARIYSDWLASEPHAEAKLAWHHAVRDYSTLSQKIRDQSNQSTDVLLDPHQYGSPEALHDYTRQKLMTAMKASFGEEYDPDKVYLSFSTLEPKSHEPPPDFLGMPLSVRSENIHDEPEWTHDKRSLTEWAQTNIDYFQKHELQFFKTPITDENNKVITKLTGHQVALLIRDVNVGKSYPEYLENRLINAPEGKAAKNEYGLLRLAEMQVEKQSAIIQNAFNVDRLERGQAWVQAVIDSPTAKERRTVEGHQIVVKQLKFGEFEGETPVRGIYIIGGADPRSIPSVVAYTPGAPDGKPFREADDFEALMKELKASPEMKNYMLERMGPENAKQKFNDGSERWSTEEIKGDFLEAEYEAGVQFSIDRIKDQARATTEGDRQANVKLGNTLGDIVLSMAHPYIAVPYGLVQTGLSIKSGITAHEKGDYSESLQDFAHAFDRAFGAFLTTGSSIKGPKFQPPARLPGGRVGYLMGPTEAPKWGIQSLKEFSPLMENISGLKNAAPAQKIKYIEILKY